MLSPITRIRFDDFTELIPAFAVVALMSFTYNVGIGITAGCVLYPLCKLVSGRVGEIKPGLWVLGGLSLLFFVFYTYSLSYHTIVRLHICMSLVWVCRLNLSASRIRWVL